MEVGDGRKVFFWHNKWVLDSPLFDHFSSRELSALGYFELDKVE